MPTEHGGRYRLRGFTFDEISLVAAGDDPAARVMIAKTARSILEVAPGDDDNWVEHEGRGLPPYIRKIASALVRDHGKPIGKAIQIAIGDCQRWAAGGGNVNADTRAKAALAVAQWELMKARARVSKAAGQTAITRGPSPRVGPETPNPDPITGEDHMPEIPQDVLDYVASLEKVNEALEAENQALHAAAGDQTDVTDPAADPKTDPAAETDPDADQESTEDPEVKDEDKDEVAKTEPEATEPEPANDAETVEPEPANDAETVEPAAETDAPAVDAPAAEPVAKSADEDDDEIAQIIKSNPAVAALVEKYEHEVAAARSESTEVIAKTAAEAAERAVIAKAESFTGFGVSTTEIAKALASVNQHCTPESAYVIEQMLTAAQTQISKSALFTEIGAGGVETTISKAAEGQAEALMKSDPTLTREQALTQIYTNNPDLYERSLEEN